MYIIRAGPLRLSILQLMVAALSLKLKYASPTIPTINISAKVAVWLKKKKVSVVALCHFHIIKLRQNTVG